MYELLIAIQASSDHALKGVVPDITPVLAAADALSEADAETLRTSSANPKAWATTVEDVLTFGKNVRAAYLARQLQS